MGQPKNLNRHFGNNRAGQSRDQVGGRIERSRRRRIGAVVNDDSVGIRKGELAAATGAKLARKIASVEERNVRPIMWWN